jgi:hypothetical protein
MDELLAATGTKENEDGEIVYAGKFLIKNTYCILLYFNFFKYYYFIDFVNKILAGPFAK